MKKSLILCTLLFTFSYSHAQLNDVLRRAKNKVNNKIDQKIDEKIDRAINKADDGVSNSTKNKKASSSNSSSENNDDMVEGKKADKKPGLSVSGKFDFVPGDKVIFIEDFSQDALGDFPAKWNTNGSGELMTINDQKNKFLELRKDVVLYPEFVKNLPENFTFEYDLASTDEFSYYSGGFYVGFTSEQNVGNKWKIFERFGNRKVDTENTVEFMVHPENAGGGQGKTELVSYGNNEEIVSNDTDQDQFTVKNGKTFVHVSIWRQKTRLRVYLNDKKIFDMPRAMPENGVYKSIYFRTQNFYKDNNAFYLGNLKLAVGAPDTRNKLITEGKFVTSGILFDVNSATVKPESYGVIREIANVLAENSNVKVQIVGHTDSDGDDAANLSLSKKRADAVKSILEKTYGVDGSRLTSDGKGESQPVDKANTAEAKANNRRVEFIKQ